MKSTTPTEVRELLEISLHAGRDLDSVQGGGGNTSVKSRDAQTMWIKASGFFLSELTDQTGYLSMDLQGLNRLMTNPSYESMEPLARENELGNRFKTLVADGSKFRPSLETGFHGTLGRVVLHTHPVYPNLINCLTDGPDALKKAFSSSDLPCVWVNYFAPGYPVAAEIYRLRLDLDLNLEHPCAFFLQNHGVIVSGKTVQEVISFYARLLQKTKNFHEGKKSDVSANMVLARTEESDLLAHTISQIAGKPMMTFRSLNETFIELAGELPFQQMLTHILFPDQAVYCGESPLFLEDGNAFKDRALLEKRLINYQEKWGYTPKIVVVRSEGTYIAEASERACRTVHENLYAVVKITLLAQGRGTLRFLGKSDIAHLLGMEGEKYRQALMAKQ